MEKKSKLSKIFYKVMLREQEKGVYDLKLIHSSNDILVSVGRPDFLKTDTGSNPKAVKRGISLPLSGIYVQEFQKRKG